MSAIIIFSALIVIALVALVYAIISDHVSGKKPNSGDDTGTRGVAPSGKWSRTSTTAPRFFE